MKLYDECLIGMGELLQDCSPTTLDFNGSSWRDAGEKQMIFQNDTAFELGGGDLPALSSVALTDSREFVPCDEVVLVGDDLPNIKGNRPFARIALLRVNEENMGDGDALYQSIRRIEYSKYHTNPDGYMMRISALSRREAVRVSKKAITNGLTFADVGKLFIDSYHKHAQVEAAKLIFITAKDFPYDELDRIMKKSESITKALDHLMKDLKMDCHACSLKAVCEEVEQLIKK